MTKSQQQALLTEAQSLLHNVLRLHTQSVMIGKLEHLEESGIIDHEIDQVRRFIERADTLCADIDRLNH